MLIIRNLTKRYGDKVILDVSALNLNQGVHWFKGKNGSGKTTLFKTLSGIIPCDAEVSLDDLIYLKKNPVQYRSLVSYSEAEPIYPGFLTPRELMKFVAAAKKATREQQRELFDVFGISDFQNKSFATCSSGMIKKLALSLAFLGTPKVIILDEPLITLDDVARGILFGLIKQYVEQLSVTFLISSHQEIDHQTLPLAGAYLIQDGKLTSI
ncbi:MAG: ABC transporter ATP-binding protein [Chryseolinea sp.]